MKEYRKNSDGSESENLFNENGCRMKESFKEADGFCETREFDEEDHELTCIQVDGAGNIQYSHG